MTGFDKRKLADLVAQRCPTHRDRQAFAVASGLGYHRLVEALERRLDGAEAVLALCAALGVDPIDLSSPPADAYGGVVLWRVFGAALSVMRQARRDSVRDATKTTRVSAATISRLERGTIVAAPTARSHFALAAYAGGHPHFWSATPAEAKALETLAHPRATGMRAAARAMLPAEPGLPVKCFTGDTP